MSFAKIPQLRRADRPRARLGAAQADALAILRARGPLSVSDVARARGTLTWSASGTIQSLMDRGLVREYGHAEPRFYVATETP